jgi:hypothetical protein
MSREGTMDSRDKDQIEVGINLQAFFSIGVNSAQDPFILSRKLIHNSACSCGGIVSHLFSTSIKVGFERGWVEAALHWTFKAARGATERLARTIEERNIFFLSFFLRIYGLAMWLKRKNTKN